MNAHRVKPLPPTQDRWLDKNQENLVVTCNYVLNRCSKYSYRERKVNGVALPSSDCIMPPKKSQKQSLYSYPPPPHRQVNYIWSSSLSWNQSQGSPVLIDTWISVWPGEYHVDLAETTSSSLSYAELLTGLSCAQVVNTRSHWKWKYL